MAYLLWTSLITLEENIIKHSWNLRSAMILFNQFETSIWLCVYYIFQAWRLLAYLTETGGVP